MFDRPETLICPICNRQYQLIYKLRPGGNPFHTRLDDKDEEKISLKCGHPSGETYNLAEYENVIAREIQE